MNTQSALDLQARLTRQSELAAKYMDGRPDGEPYSDRFHRNITLHWQDMNLFDAVESSLRRAGLKGCIRATESDEDEAKGCEGYIPSCWACVEPLGGEKQGYDRKARAAND